MVVVYCSSKNLTVRCKKLPVLVARNRTSRQPYFQRLICPLEMVEIFCVETEVTIDI